MSRGQDAACIVITDEHNRVLLVHQTYGSNLWALPGGLVDEGESAWEAARRELLEEAGVQVASMEMAGVYYQTHQQRYVFVFRSQDRIGPVQVDGQEIDEAGWYALDALPRPMLSYTEQRIKNAMRSSGTVFAEEHAEQRKIL